MISEAWRRVTHEYPCPICKKTDWCLINNDGKRAICQRVESTRRAGEAGWIHYLGDNLSQEYASRPAQAPTAKLSSKALLSLAEEYFLGTSMSKREEQAMVLGVSLNSLVRMNVGWDGYSWTFPMKNACDEVVGILRRYDDGRKMSVKGGTLGLFVPNCLEIRADNIIVCEGATDTAAVLTMGAQNVIGRPNCSSGSHLICELIAKHKTKSVIILSDNDDAGIGGANCLAVSTTKMASTKIVTPPSGIKDARKWLSAGGTIEALRMLAFVSPEIK